MLTVLEVVSNVMRVVRQIHSPCTFSPCTCDLFFLTKIVSCHTLLVLKFVSKSSSFSCSLFMRLLADMGPALWDLSKLYKGADTSLNNISMWGHVHKYTYGSCRALSCSSCSRIYPESLQMHWGSHFSLQAVLTQVSHLQQNHNQGESPGNSGSLNTRITVLLTTMCSYQSWGKHLSDCAWKRSNSIYLLHNLTFHLVLLLLR